MGLKESFQFIDLFSFDPLTAEEFGIPTDQCKGMILLFPLNEGEEEKVISTKFESAGEIIKPKFIKQTIDNSCCLMALLHLLLNNSKELLNQSNLPEIIKNLLNSESNNEKLIENSCELREIHEEIARIGETELPNLDDNVPFHFVALIPFEGSVWLMDGRLDGPDGGPVNCKSYSEGLFFECACNLANEEFVQKSTDQTNFAAVILI